MSPLTCKDFDERLLDYLYDELGAEEDQAIAVHLAGCARCMMEVQAFRRVRQAARALPIAEPSASVTARLLEAAAAHGQELSAAPASAGSGLAAAPSLRPAHNSPPPAMAPAPRAMAAPVTASAMAAAAPARSRRGFFATLRHPGFAAAASFLVVGVGAVWMMSYHHDVLEAPAMRAESPPPEAPVMVVAPPQSPSAAPVAAVAPQSDKADQDNKVARAKKLDFKNLDVKGSADRVVASPEDAPVQTTPAAGKKAPAAPAAHGMVGHLAANDDLDSLGDGAGWRTGTGGSAGPSQVAARPAMRAEPVPPPATGRSPSGDGRWLHKDENRALAQSLGGSAPGQRPGGEGLGEPGAGATAANSATTAAPMNAMEAQKQDRRVEANVRRAEARPEASVEAKVEAEANAEAQVEKRLAAEKSAVADEESRERSQAQLQQAAPPKRKAAAPTKVAAKRDDAESGGYMKEQQPAAPKPVAVAPAAPPPPPAAMPARQEAPSASQGRGQGQSQGMTAGIPASAAPATAGAVPHDLQHLIAQFRGDVILLNNCDGAVERYGEIRARYPSHAFTAGEHLDVAHCFEKLRRWDEARVELRAVRDLSPSAGAQVDHELAGIDQRESSIAHRQHAAPASPPMRASKKAKSAPAAKASDAMQAPAAY